MSEIIVTSKSSNFATIAFDLNAVDYLQCPVKIERFIESIHRLEKRLISRKKSMNFPIEDETLTEKKLKKLVMREQGRIKLFDFSEIKYFKASGNYVEIHFLNGTRTMHRETLQAIEKKVDETEFRRIHKSILVRMDLIDELTSLKKGDYRVKLRSGEQFTLTRRNKDNLMELLN